jgi:uncharacterized protein YuzE
MRVRYDPDADALYIRLDETPIANSAEVGPGIVLDYDSAGRVVGIEVLDAARRLPGADFRRIQFEVHESADASGSRWDASINAQNAPRTSSPPRRLRYS